MAGRHDVDVGLARQAFRNARVAGAIADAGPTKLRAQEPERHFDESEILPRQGSRRRINDDSGANARIVYRLGRRRLAVVKLCARAGRLLAEAGDPGEIPISTRLVAPPSEKPMKPTLRDRSPPYPSTVIRSAKLLAVSAARRPATAKCVLAFIPRR